MSVTQRPVAVETEEYPSHEEDSAPEHPEHEYQVWELRSTLRKRLPQHWITGDVCMYWLPQDKSTYVAPDVLVVQGTERGAEQGPYRVWCDPPALFVGEISSRSTAQDDEFVKPETLLLDLRVAEYLFFDRLRPRLRLWRGRQGQITEATPNAAGRLASEGLGLEFGVVEGRLRVFEPDGRMLATPEEEFDLVEQERRRALEALQRAEQERQRAAALEVELERLREQLRRGEGAGAEGAPS